jgi:stage II sporulation protein M
MPIMSRVERRAYTARLMPYLAASLTLFFLGGIAGLIIVQQVPDLADRFADTLAAFVKGFAGMPRWQLAIAIFLNNSVKTLIALLLGTLFGIVPSVFLLANGAALGVALSLSIQTRGLSTSLVSVLPHGIIELPAVFLGMSIGLLLGAHALMRLRGRSETPVGAEIRLGISYFCAVILPLLLLAAFVEAFVTAALISPR